MKMSPLFQAHFPLISPEERRFRVQCDFFDYYAIGVSARVFDGEGSPVDDVPVGVTMESASGERVHVVVEARTTSDTVYYTPLSWHSCLQSMDNSLFLLRARLWGEGTEDWKVRVDLLCTFEIPTDDPDWEEKLRRIAMNRTAPHGKVS